MLSQRAAVVIHQEEIKRNLVMEEGTQIRDSNKSPPYSPLTPLSVSPRSRKRALFFPAPKRAPSTYRVAKQDSTPGGTYSSLKLPQKLSSVTLCRCCVSVIDSYALFMFRGGNPFRNVSRTDISSLNNEETAIRFSNGCGRDRLKNRGNGRPTHSNSNRRKRRCCCRNRDENER